VARPEALPAASRKLMDDALARHRAGGLAQAEAMYRELLRQVPGHPDVHHLLGLALYQQGRNAEARGELEAAIRAFEPAPHYHNSLGESLRVSRDLDAALGEYRRALELEPGYLEAQNNLGLTLHAMGRFAEAADAFEQVLAREPGLPHAHNNLGIAKQALGDLPGAIASFRKAAELAPQHVQAWNNLGGALHARGDLEGARQALQRAIEIEPGLARAHYNLSRVHVALGDLERAEADIRRALERDGRDGQYYVHLGLVLRARGRFEESVAALHQALEHAPRHPVAHNDLGVTLLMSGEFEQAEKHLLAAVDSAPLFTIAYENLARARRFGPGDAPLMRRLESLLSDPRVDDSGRMHLGFALGKMWDDRDEPERAFPHFDAANSIAHGQNPWDAAARSRSVDRLISVFDESWFRERQGPDFGDATSAPVLIVGMPRSGTTLIEQILASHPQVHACGETDFFANLAAIMPGRLGLAGTEYPECARTLSSSDLGGIARSYLSKTLGQAGGKTRFTDKNPLNFDHLGLAAVMFPNARLIHVTRDPRDTCLSIFTTHFSRDNAFAYSLEDIASFYRDYLRLMAHWRRHLGSRLLEVAYEDVVAHQEEASRRLLDACGLAWDPACLEFHHTRRMVGTASHWQVRQPLYSGAVGRSAPYARWLSGVRIQPDS